MKITKKEKTFQRQLELVRLVRHGLACLDGKAYWNALVACTAEAVANWDNVKYPCKTLELARPLNQAQAKAVHEAVRKYYELKSSAIETYSECYDKTEKQVAQLKKRGDALDAKAEEAWAVMSALMRITCKAAGIAAKPKQVKVKKEAGNTYTCTTVSVEEPAFTPVGVLSRRGELVDNIQNAKADRLAGTVTFAVANWNNECYPHSTIQRLEVLDKKQVTAVMLLIRKYNKLVLESEKACDAMPLVLDEIDEIDEAIYRLQGDMEKLAKKAAHLLYVAGTGCHLTAKDLKAANEVSGEFKEVFENMARLTKSKAKGDAQLSKLQKQEDVALKKADEVWRQLDKLMQEL